MESSREQSVEEVEHPKSTTSSEGRAAEEETCRSEVDAKSPAPVVPVKRAFEIRRRKIELARKRLEIEMRELELEEEQLSEQGVGEYAEKMEAWLQDAQRIEQAPARHRNSGRLMVDDRIGQLPLDLSTTATQPARVIAPKKHLPFTPALTSSLPSYDRTFANDQAAAQERELAEWRRSVEDIIVTHKESQAKWATSPQSKSEVASKFQSPVLTPSQRAAREGVKAEYQMVEYSTILEYSKCWKIKP
uniref:Uncharacterized protein n=1 Tax=Anopheles dirus TaxID=7168 RepID=A0A182NXJ8_9DIPT